MNRGAVLFFFQGPKGDCHLSQIPHSRNIAVEHRKSEEAFEQARRFLPGGVNSPVRAYAAVGGRPVFIASAKGSHITDIDGNDYIDYVCSWGPLILGHSDEEVVAAVTEAAARGMSFGAPTLQETELAAMICEMVPSIEKVRMVNSGTEAAMSAIRVARGCTGRDVVVKFEGCYHGHADALLVKAGSGAATFGSPRTGGRTAAPAGVPESVTRDTLVLPYNDAQAFAGAMKANGGNVACVIVEPVAGNMGVVPPVEGFLETLRELTTKYGALLIFDEVITGFRLAPGGAQELYGVVPDMTTLGKIIGGGLPVGAYGGRADVMVRVSPEGPVYQAGTLSGNPVATAAGLATLKRLRAPGFYGNLEKKAKALADGLEKAARAAGAQTQHARVGSMLCAFFRREPVRDYAEALESDGEKYARFFNAMLERGICLAPSRFETMFVSAAHTEADIARTIQAARESFAVAE